MLDELNNSNKRVYAPRVVLERAQMEIESGPVQLLSGMAVPLEIKTGPPCIMSYLLSPLLRFRREFGDKHRNTRPCNQRRRAAPRRFIVRAS